MPTIATSRMDRPPSPSTLRPSGRGGARRPGAGPGRAAPRRAEPPAGRDGPGPGQEPSHVVGVADLRVVLGPVAQDPAGALERPKGPGVVTDAVDHEPGDAVLVLDARRLDAPAEELTEVALAHPRPEVALKIGQARPAGPHALRPEGPRVVRARPPRRAAGTDTP